MKIWKVIKRYLYIVRRSYILSKKLFFIQFAQCILNCFLVAINIVLPKLIVQQIMNGNYVNIIFVVCAVFLFNIIWAIIDLKAVPYINVKNEEMNIKIVNSFLSKSYSLKLEYFDNGNAYNKYNIVFDNCCDIFHNAKNIFLQFLSSIMQIFFVLSVLCWIDFRIIILIFFVVFLNIIISKKKKRISYIYCIF